MEPKRCQSYNCNLKEDWRKVRKLGAGSFGVVKLWESFPGGNYVAVKKFRVPPGSQSLLEKCKEEVERMIAIDHPNIVATIKPSKELLAKLSQKKLTWSSTTETYPFLCMEYCCGGDLRQMLKRPEYLSGLPEKEVLAVLSNISGAIAYLHSQPIGKGRYIIHRDIKPANIVIQRDSILKRNVYKLSDLGLAKDVSSDESQCSTFLGTPEYIAPEIFQKKKYDKTVDFWSFGLIAYEISCGSRQLRTDTDSSGLVTEIPEKTHLSEFFRKCLSNWLSTMLQYQPENRGKYKILVGDRETTTCSLVWLQSLLSATFLHVYTSTKGRLVFRVRSNTAISHVQQWVSKITGLQLEDQLLLTMDGRQVSSVDLAVNYAKNNTRLYLVARIGQEISTIILPKLWSGFFIDNTDSPLTCHTSHLKQLWSLAIFNIQCQLERTEDLLKIQEALKNWGKRNSSGRMAKTENKMMHEWYMQFRDLRSSFNALISMQEKLDEINFNFVGELESPQCLLDIKTSAHELHSRIEMYFREYFTYCYENGSLQLKDSNCSILQDLCRNLLRQYESSSYHVSSNESCTVKNWNEVRRIITLFRTTQQSLLNNLDFNIKLLRQSATTFEEREVKIQDWLLTLKGYEDKVMKLGLKKQKMILEFSFPPASPTLVTENPVVMDVRPANPQTIGCYGRSRAVSPVKYLSFLPVPETGHDQFSISISEMCKIIRMAGDKNKTKSVDS